MWGEVSFEVGLTIYFLHSKKVIWKKEVYREAVDEDVSCDLKATFCSDIEDL